jgi:hypothetical protein
MYQAVALCYIEPLFRMPTAPDLEFVFCVSVLYVLFMIPIYNPIYEIMSTG